ncbi:hypothetical protein, partial [Phocaeicola coprophilus]|uniref:hypothetical protein n=1 Tax=Phocaeicola coprophilus TaxID=387090 RepID=UPI0039F48E53
RQRYNFIRITPQVFTLILFCISKNNIYIYLQTQSVMRIIARSKVVENYTEHPGETFRTSWVSPSRVSDYLTGRCEQP